MNKALKAEPAVIVSTLTAVVTAIIGLLVAFGIDVSEEQKNAIITAIGAIVPMIFLTGVIIRQTVYSPATVEKIADAQYRAGTPPQEPQPEVPPPAQVN